jgi:hypothetical protein
MNAASAHHTEHRLRSSTVLVDAPQITTVAPILSAHGVARGGQDIRSCERCRIATDVRFRSYVGLCSEPTEIGLRLNRWHCRYNRNGFGIKATNMAHRGFGRGLALAYALTIFLSAFLLFQVQPLIGKYILPWFGGSPAV